MQGIYKIVNLLNDKVYIGSSKDIRERWRQHRNKLTNNVHSNTYLQRAWNKYGSNSFKFSVIEEVINTDNLIEREQYYMDKLDPEYNIIPKADRSKMSERTKKKISETLEGRELSEKHSEKLNKLNTGASHPAGKITKKEGTEIKRTYESNKEKTQKELAQQYDVHRRTILRIVNGNHWTTKELGSNSRPRGSKITKKEAKVIKKDYVANDEKTFVDLAQEYEISEATICLIVNGNHWATEEIA